MNRKLLHFCSVAVVLFLAALFLYFYITGRIDPYVAPEFRRWALVAGLGLAVLGLFNMATANQAAACGHDHSHDHGDGDGDCCGHDHGPGHSHAHDDAGGEDHHHHEESASGVILALVVLTVPMLVAANSSVDRFSTEYAIRWANITEKLHRLELNRKREREQAVAKAEPKQTPHGGPVVAERAQQSPLETASSTVPGADTPPAPAAASEGEGTEIATADTPPATRPVGVPQAADEGAGAADSPPTDAKESDDDDGWGEFTLEDLKRMVPQSSDGNFMLEVPQLFYTANDTELQRVLEGLPIETIAQVMPVTSDDADSGGELGAVPATPTPIDNRNRLRLFRMFIECCAADMRPLPVTIQFKDGVPEYEEMGWVKVVGKVRYEHVDGVTTPIVDVMTMEPTAEPMDMMVY